MTSGTTPRYSYEINCWFTTGPGGLTTWSGNLQRAVALGLREFQPGGNHDTAHGVTVARDSRRELVPKSQAEFEQWLDAAPTDATSIDYSYDAWAPSGEPLTRLFENMAKSPDEFREMMRNFYRDNPNPGRVVVSETSYVELWTLLRDGTERVHEQRFLPGETRADIVRAHRQHQNAQKGLGG